MVVANILPTVEQGCEELRASDKAGRWVFETTAGTPSMIETASLDW